MMARMTNGIRTSSSIRSLRELVREICGELYPAFLELA
jgi:hypothetical protein